MTEIWYTIEKVFNHVFGAVTEDFSYSLVAVSKKCRIKFLAPLPRIDLKENLNINIPTKERIANFDIFLFYQKISENLQKYF